MSTPTLREETAGGLTFLTDPEAAPVRFGFTERAGGVSEGPWASLNLGDACGDDPEAVAENRTRALRALGYEGDPSRLVNPKQVHGDKVLVVDAADDAHLAAFQKEARAGLDAVVCTAAGIPVLLCYADCVPVVLTAPRGFAVIHSGWRGTIAKISARALAALCQAADVAPSDVHAYIGPHIAGADYEVSRELLDRFEEAFGAGVALPERHLDLAAAIESTLLEAGMDEGSICDCGISTAQETDRFYSYRASGGTCGRHGALAFIETCARP